MAGPDPCPSGNAISERVCRVFLAVAAQPWLARSVAAANRAAGEFAEDLVFRLEVKVDLYALNATASPAATAASPAARMTYPLRVGEHE